MLAPPSSLRVFLPCFWIFLKSLPFPVSNWFVYKPVGQLPNLAICTPSFTSSPWLVAHREECTLHNWVESILSVRSLYKTASYWGTIQFKIHQLTNDYWEGLHEYSRTLTSSWWRLSGFRRPRRRWSLKRAVSVVDSSILIALCDEVNVRFVWKTRLCLPASSEASLISLTAFIPPTFRGPSPVGVSINARLFLASGQIRSLFANLIEWTFLNWRNLHYRGGSVLNVKHGSVLIVNQYMWWWLL